MLNLIKDDFLFSSFLVFYFEVTHTIYSKINNKINKIIDLSILFNY